MQPDPNFFAGAHGTNASQSTFTAVSANVYNYHSTEEKEILATLRPVERVGHANGCLEGTRQTTLQEINDWLDDFAAPNILLLSGSPGSGKSAIAATIVADLDRRRRLGASFAFKHSDTILSDPDVVWRTIAFDLARFDSEVKENLVEILMGVDPGGANLDLQFQRLIEAPLTQSRQKLSANPPVVVLDALDECGSDRSQSDRRRTFLNSLKKWAGLPSLFKLIVTSRDERLPNSFRHVCKPLVLETGSRVSDETSSDIQLFLETRFADIVNPYPSLSKWPGEPRIKALTKRAAGLFIWAETLVRFVGDEDCLPNEQLHLIESGGFDLDGDVIHGLYRRIIDASFEHSTDHTLNAFRAVVGAIILAKIPLRRDDLIHLISPPVDGPLMDHILKKLSSVISIGRANRLIHICHLSFSEFLCENAQFPRYLIDRAMHSWHLASACFRLMKANLKFNICSLQTSHLRNDDVPDLPARIQKSIPPHLSYACCFVAQHLRELSEKGAMLQELLTDIAEFLHSRLLYWLEVMSLIGEIPLALAALFSMKICIGTADPDLAAFAADAARFAVNFATPISQSAPHIYLSALPWSPCKSKVAQHFLCDFPQTLCILSGQDNDWPAVINVLVGHRGEITSVGLSPDGKFVVSGSEDETIRIWDIETGEVVAGPFEGHTDYITSVGFSPDGKHVVSGSRDHTVRVWNIETGDVVSGPFQGHTDWVRSVGYSPDGKHIVSGGDTTLCIWNTETNELVAGPFKGHTSWITSVGFLPDGNHIVSGSWDKTICVWDSETGEVVSGPFKGHTDGITSVGMSPDGKCIASCSRDQTICIWSTETGDMITGPFRGHTGSIYSVAFSPNGKQIVSGSWDKTICIWDIETNEVVAGPFKGHTDSVTSVGFSPDGKQVFSGSSDEKILIWNTETDKVVGCPSKSHTHWIMSVAFSPDGKHIASGSADKTICIWNPETGGMVSGPFKGHTGPVLSIAFSPNGKYIVSGSGDKTACIWETETGNVVAGPFHGHTDWITSVGFSHDGKQIVSGSLDKTICIWSYETGLGEVHAVVGHFKGHADGIMSVVFSPDSKCIVSGSRDKTICIWDTETGELIAGPCKGHTALIMSVAFSQDGKYVVSGSGDNTICIWDTETGEMVAGPFKGHSEPITSVGFSPDARHIVSGSWDRTIRIWDSETGEMIAGPFRGHMDWVRSVGFSPDGQYVVSGSDDKTIRIWNTTSEMDQEVTDCCKKGLVRSTACSAEMCSDSKDKTVHICHASHFGKFHHCHFDFQQGWVKTDDRHGLLFWVPVHCQGFVCGTDTVSIIGENMRRVTLAAFVHGSQWMKCHQMGKEISDIQSNL